MFNLLCLISAVEKNSFQGNDGNKIDYTTIFLKPKDGRVFRVGTDKNFDFAQFEGKTVLVEFSVTPAQDLKATIRAMKVVPTTKPA